MGKIYSVPDEISINRIDSSESNDFIKYKYKVLNKKIFTNYYVFVKKHAEVRIRISLILLAISLILAMILGVQLAAMKPSMNIRQGTVKNNRISYIKGDKKEVNLKDYGIETLTDSDKVNIYFDNSDTEIIEIVPIKLEKSKENRLIAETVLIILFTPIIVCAIAFGGNGKFRIFQAVENTYAYELRNGNICMQRLCRDLNLGCISKSDLEIITLSKVIKRKEYKGISYLKCKLYYPSLGETKIERVWILKDEPLHDTVVNYKGGDI